MGVSVLSALPLTPEDTRLDSVPSRSYSSETVSHTGPQDGGGGRTGTASLPLLPRMELAAVQLLSTRWRTTLRNARQFDRVSKAPVQPLGSDLSCSDSERVLRACRERRSRGDSPRSRVS